MRPILLRTGSPNDALRAERGEYEAWFARSMGVPVDTFTVIDAQTATQLPVGVDAVIVSGSTSSVHHREPWSVAASQWLARVVRSGAPVLGVCYGHQMLGDVFGGEVGPNPNGRDIGVLEVEVEDDPLFEGLPSRFTVVQTHTDAVNKAPRDALVLGRSSTTPVEAMAFGDHARSVQWHPEFDADVIRQLIDIRAHLIDAEKGEGTAERLRDAVHPTDTGPRILRNFARHFLRMDV